MMSSRSLLDGLSAFLLIVSRTSMSFQVGTSTPVFTSVPFPAPFPSQASVVSIPSAWLVTWQIQVYSPTSLLPALREAADSCAAERNHSCQGGVIHAVSSITHNWKTTFKIRNEEAHDGRKVQAYLFITRFIEGFFSFFSTAPLLFSSLFTSSLLQGFSNML